MKKSFIVMIILLFIPGLFLNAQLVDNGDGTITDTGKGIMWTKNASLSGSTSLTYTEAVNWVNNLDYAGYQDWRLPAGTDPSNDPYRSTEDNQYYYNCGDSEFGNLFYTVLGGYPGFSIDEVPLPNPPYTIVTNTDPDLGKFENILGPTANACIFWTNIPKNATNTWTFNFDNGSYKALLSSASSTYRLRAWAVRDVTGQSNSHAAPTSFAVLNGYNDSIILAWSPPADMTSFLGYKVHRYTQQGTHSVLANNIQTQYYRDETAVNGTTYSYSVSAVYSTGESDVVTPIQGTAQANGFTLQCGSVSTEPAIDGSITQSEWTAAEAIDIAYPGYSSTVTLYAMNDDTHLYLAVNDPGDHMLDNYDGIGIIFDEDHNREWPATDNGQEGILQLYWYSGAPGAGFQGFYGSWPDQVHGSSWSKPAGITHQMSTSSGHVQLEAKLDLNTSPFNASGGDVLGIFFYSYDGSSGFNGAWPQETIHLESMTTGNAWAHGAFCFGEFILSHYSSADFDGDGDVDISDVQKVAGRWGTSEGDANYDALYDVDHDGDIDIVDVQKVAALWGTIF